MLPMLVLLQNIKILQCLVEIKHIVLPCELPLFDPCFLPSVNGPY